MLGVTIRFDSYHDAEEHLCRVTEVMNAVYEPNYLAWRYHRSMFKTLSFIFRWKTIHLLIWLDCALKKIIYWGQPRRWFNLRSIDDLDRGWGGNAEWHCQLAICLAFSLQQPYYSISHSLVTLFLTFLKVFRDTDVLYEELAANLETPVEFYVYNADSDEVPSNSFDHRNPSRNFSLIPLIPSYASLLRKLIPYNLGLWQVRIAVVMPSDQWGGSGLLGDVATINWLLSSFSSTFFLSLSSCSNSRVRKPQTSLQVRV